MGTSISHIRDDTYKNVETNRRMEVEERLHILERTVQSMLEKEKSQLVISGDNQSTIYAGAVVDVLELVNVIMGRNDTSSSIKMVVDSFLSEVNQKEFGLLIQYCAAGIVDKSAVGEYEGRDMLILKANAFSLCCDIYYYRWNFVVNSIKDVRGVIGVLLVKRVIDPVKTIHQLLEKHIVDQMNRALEWKKRSEPGEVEGESIQPNDIFTSTSHIRKNSALSGEVRMDFEI